MVVYIQKDKILSNINTLSKLNKQIEDNIVKQKALIEQELTLRLELFKLQGEISKIEKQIAKEVSGLSIVLTER